MLRVRLSGSSRCFLFVVALCCFFLFFVKFFFSAPQHRHELGISRGTYLVYRADPTPFSVNIVSGSRQLASTSQRRYNITTLRGGKNAITPTIADGTTTPGQKAAEKRLSLFVAILSAPIRFDRREGIRATWMSDCNTFGVVCRFFTDPLSDMKPRVVRVLLNESRINSDLEFMEVPSGYNFGRRILWLMEWSARHYDYDYLLRVDDDYFVCLKRLLFELPHRPHTRLYWGHVHCAIEGLVRVDEAFLVLSSDLVHEFLARKKNLLCHPFGDQTVALWINEAKNVTYFHDPRVHHEVTSLKPQFKFQREICQTYLSLHGSYLHEMLTYWDIVAKENSTRFWIPSVQPLSDVCPLSTHFDWRAMQGPPYGWEPKPCSLNPVWDLGAMHRGRNMI